MPLTCFVTLAWKDNTAGEFDLCSPCTYPRAASGGWRTTHSHADHCHLSVMTQTTGEPTRLPAITLSLHVHSVCSHPGCPYTPLCSPSSPLPILITAHGLVSYLTENAELVRRHLYRFPPPSTCRPLSQVHCPCCRPEPVPLLVP